MAMRKYNLQNLDRDYITAITALHTGQPTLQSVLKKAKDEANKYDPYYINMISFLHSKKPAATRNPSNLELSVEAAIRNHFRYGNFKDSTAEDGNLKIMSLGELDTYYIKSVGSLHGGEIYVNTDPTNLQLNLEEAIKSKTGVAKDYSPLIASFNNRPLEEIRTATHGLEESKTTSSSDNELELDLFNEDLMCIICNGMDVGARNRLLECSDCHSLYHQECHRPPVTTFDTESNWTCQNCKDASKRVKKSTPGSSPSHAATPSPLTTKSSLKNSPPHSQRVPISSSSNSNSSSTSQGSSYKAPSAKSMSSTSISKPSTSSSKSSGKSSSTATTSVKSSATPTIISADKRLQIMKKKAAKLHEKRKQQPR